ncbi:hypothetical protein CC78DRAFT_266744 [Lojkania enalia]|uniref:DUF7137 domain-containing protein n=1 Tax=Lojkania enalia TaxID=147567 RepID=A0A9P4K8L7_9PLEO|nr:hypothetical protein CC78DRAFT_266744 [Didymosphaeria enalia]
MRPSQLLAAVVALSSLSAAWPDAFVDSVRAVGDVHNIIYGRQDNADSSVESSSRPTPTNKDDSSSTTEGAETTARETDRATTTRDEDAKTTDKASGSQKVTGTKTAKSSKTPEFDPRLPAGGISMVTPAAIAGPQYYKVGDWVTFAWNYTSLSVTPSAIDILATCTANQATYTLAVNQSTEETGKILWDTGAYQATASVPLLTETYTLIIYDSESSVSATARPGYLGAYSQFTFGMYLPQKYVSFDRFECANCVKNAVGALTDSLTIKMMLFTGTTTIASFLYFASSFGLL